MLIDEILDFSKIEAGRLALENALFELNLCVQTTIELLAPTAHEKDLELAWTINPDLPLSIMGDEARVRQILLNLVGNAIKFTDRGGVLITVEPGPADTAGDPTIEIQIKDTGIGLSADSIKRLFSEFSQADIPLAQRRGGTGLGLAISRRIANAMGGTITVSSEPGRGATFTARLPLHAAIGSQSIRDNLNLTQSSDCVLLAFDRLIERRALARSMRSLGVEVRECDDPSVKSEIDAAAADGQPVTLVIADAAADAEEAAEALRIARTAAGNHNVRGIVLIDAMAKSNLKKFRQFGFDSYLVRPVRPLALVAQLGLLASNMSSANSSQPAGATPPATSEAKQLNQASSSSSYSAYGPHSILSANYRVLLAEDNAINALLATRMLEAVGCNVHHVSDGEQAVRAFAKSIEPGGNRYDIILMDVHLPQMDGLEATAEIRQMIAQSELGDAANVPIIALTANAFADDRAQCIAAGLDDYLAKPFDKKDLFAVLERWCTQPKSGRPVS